MIRAFAALLLLGGCTTISRDAAPPAHQAAAWVRFDTTGITASGADGMAAPGRPLAIDDPVRIASISKLVVALGVMRAVEQGVLDLDADVSRHLGWEVRNPAFPDRPITLRHLLSHTSGLRDDVDYALPLDATLQEALANPKAFAPAHPPGAFFKYSNLGFPVIATVMERATGERFDRLMDRLVIRPLGLSACYNWSSCSDATLARAVVLTEPDGTPIRDDLGGKQPACPVVPARDGSCDWQAYKIGTNGALFSPQGGLRISARDLATVGRLLLNRGRHDGAAFLSPAGIAEMARPQWMFDGSNGDSEDGFYCAYGLGVQILSHCPPHDDLFGDERPHLGHAGDAYGLKSGLWIAGTAGVAYFATGIVEDAPRGRTAYRTIEEWLAARANR